MTHDVSDADVDNWLAVIRKMIYAFENKEPDSEQYNFNIDFNFEPLSDEELKENPQLEGCKVYKSKIDNQDEYEKFKQAQDEHEDKVKEGLELFAKYFNHLWI